MNLKTWILGLVSAFLTGIGSGVVLIIADPATFNFDDGLSKLIKASVVFGLFGAGLYLKQSPIYRRDDDARGNGPGYGMIAIGVLTAPMLLGAGCALPGATPQERAAAGVHRVIIAIDEVERVLPIPVDRRAETNTAVIKVLQTGRTIVRVLKAWPTAFDRALLTTFKAEIEAAAALITKALPAGFDAAKWNAAIADALAVAESLRAQFGGQGDEANGPEIDPRVGAGGQGARADGGDAGGPAR